MFQRIKEAIGRFMYGRYGVDQLGKHLNYAFLGCWVLGMILHSEVLYLISLALIVVTYYRMLSKDYTKRSAENRAYLQWLWKMKCKFAKNKEKLADKEHRYYRCPKCKQGIRVPRGKGKIEIKCPKCGTNFVKRT